MTLTLAEPLPAREPADRLITLIGLFWTFTYVLLTIRGALFHDDWGRLLDNNRLLAVSVGAGAYAMVLRQLRTGHRISLGGAIVWTTAATLAVMIVRVTVDELMFDVPQGIAVNMLWSLSWSAYFALWVVGSVAFAPPAGRIEAVRFDFAATSTAADPDVLEELVSAILAETDVLDSSDRSRLAARIIKLGGYECADGSPRDNERARLAIRIAARLTERA